jgi:hypothetical protein
MADFDWLLRCLKLGYDIEYIPRTTMLYRIHQASVGAASFRSGQDLIERLEIFGTYCQESYATKQELRAVRMQVAYIAVKRVGKQLLAGHLQYSRSMLSVCWRALRG